jgi:hypothetical protein
LWTSMCRCSWRVIISWDISMHVFFSGFLQQESKPRKDSWQRLAKNKARDKLVIPQCRTSHVQYAGRWRGFAHPTVTVFSCRLPATIFTSVQV